MSQTLWLDVHSEGSQNDPLPSNSNIREKDIHLIDVDALLASYASFRGFDVLQTIAPSDHYDEGYIPSIRDIHCICEEIPLYTYRRIGHRPL